MDFYTWLYDQNKKTDKAAQDAHDETWAEHLAHHHPNGYDPSTDRCTLVDRDKGVDVLGNPPRRADVDSPHYYEEISKGKSFDEMRDWLESNCGGNTKCVFAQSYEDLESTGLNSNVISKFADEGDFPSKQEFEDSCRGFYGIAKDLKTRFPLIPLDIDFFIPFNFEGRKLGNASRDKRYRDLSYVGIKADSKKMVRPDGNYFKEGRLRDDVLRHELGHNLATQAVFDGAVRLLDSYAKEHGFLDTFYKLSSCVSPNSAAIIYHIAEARSTKRTPEYIRYFDETLAELFSVYTAPHYKEGHMPRQFEEIGEMMVRPQNKRNTEDRIAQDEVCAVGDEISTRMESAKELADKLDNCFYCAGRPTEYGCWDTATGKWNAYEAGSREAKMQQLFMRAKGMSEKEFVSELRKLGGGFPET